MKLPICKRLRCCAELVPQGARVADIGCDHGYLGIHLLLSGQAQSVHACDLRKAPIHRAMENAQRFGTAEKIRFSLADGLDAILPDEVDTIVCAGMGADCMIGILRAAPWIQSCRLILQPQTSGQDLRRYLRSDGFSILRETLAMDGNFLYTILEAGYTGETAALTPGAQFVSPQLLADGSPLLPRYLSRLRSSMGRTLEGLENGRYPEKQRYYAAALQEIEELSKQYDNCERDL